MNATGSSSKDSKEAATRKNVTTVERASDRELVVTRVLDAPARIIYDAWTRPELLRRWWAPRSRGVVLFECEVDARVGGRYRFVFGRNPSERMAFSGTYTEIVPGRRVVCTQLFEPIPEAGEAIVTDTFEETEGRTRFVLHQLFPSKQSLDGAIASGMEPGMRETYEQLEALVAELR